MGTRQFFVKALCVTICLASAPYSEEELAKEFIEHVLSNTEKVQNSVLGRLERNRPREWNRQLAPNEDWDESLEGLPEYTEAIEDSRIRGLRQLGLHVSLPQNHFPICHVEKKIKKLNTKEHEYRPAYYEEVYCTSMLGDDNRDDNEICSSLGLTCVQLNKTLHLTRRRYSSDCWETRTMVIPAGCECMWPSHRLGDIKFHG